MQLLRSRFSLHGILALTPPHQSHHIMARILRNVGICHSCRALKCLGGEELVAATFPQKTPQVEPRISLSLQVRVFFRWRRAATEPRADRHGSPRR